VDRVRIRTRVRVRVRVGRRVEVKGAGRGFFCGEEFRAEV